jgi:chemotaxis protein MotB
MAPRHLLAILALGHISGCVAQSKYAQLEGNLELARKENARLRQQVSTLEARQEAREKAYQELLADLRPLIDRGVLKVSLVGERVTIGMASDVLFASGSAELSSDGATNVLELARALRLRAADHDFQVEGHTDGAPISTPQFPSNWHLGAARALTVVRAMVEAGFPAANLSAASFGSEQPVAPNASEAGRAQNRRIEVVLLPDLSVVPGLTAPADREPKPAGRRPPRGPR